MSYAYRKVSIYVPKATKIPKTTGDGLARAPARAPRRPLLERTIGDAAAIEAGARAVAGVGLAVHAGDHLPLLELMACL